MARPATVGALLAGLFAAALVPVVASAAAPTCPSFADAANDDSFAASGASQTHDADLDIVAGGFSSDAERLTSTVTVAQLKAGPDRFLGDAFSTYFTVNGKVIQLYSFRYNPAQQHAVIDNAYNKTGAFVDGANPSPMASTVVGTYDLAKSTVTISIKRSELDRLTGAPTAGKAMTALSAQSAFFAGRSRFGADTATAPATLTYDVGAACTTAAPGPQPTTAPSATPTAPSASPTASPTAAPTGSPTATPTGAPTAPLPDAECNTIGDVKGDANHTVAGGAPGVQEPDLDITGLVLEATPDVVRSYVRVNALKSRPQSAIGHTYYTVFTVGGKVVSLVASGFDPAQMKTVVDTISTTSNGARQPSVRMTVAGTYVPSSITATFDTTNSMVVVSVPRAELETAVGAPIPDGTELSVVYARTASSYGPSGGFFVDSTVLDNGTASTATWVTGDNACFAPPDAQLLNVGATAAQYTDSVAVAGRLLSAAGTPLAGKAVRFAVGSRAVTAVTGADGVARTAFNPLATAGGHTLVTTFAGDKDAGPATITTPFAVVAEKTKVVLTVTRSGTRRTVVAKLTDDDGRAVAGQTITWLVNGKRISSAKTSSTGTVTFRSALPGQTVTARFAAVAGKYEGSSAAKKV